MIVDANVVLLSGKEFILFWGEHTRCCYFGPMKGKRRFLKRKRGTRKRRVESLAMLKVFRLPLRALEVLHADELKLNILLEKAGQDTGDFCGCGRSEHLNACHWTFGVVNRAEALV